MDAARIPDSDDNIYTAAAVYILHDEPKQNWKAVNYFLSILGYGPDRMPSRKGRNVKIDPDGALLYEDDPRYKRVHRHPFVLYDETCGEILPEVQIIETDDDTDFISDNRLLTEPSPFEGSYHRIILILDTNECVNEDDISEVRNMYSSFIAPIAQDFNHAEDFKAFACQAYSTPLLRLAMLSRCIGCNYDADQLGIIFGLMLHVPTLKRMLISIKDTGDTKQAREMLSSIQQVNQLMIDDVDWESSDDAAKAWFIRNLIPCGQFAGSEIGSYPKIDNSCLFLDNLQYIDDNMVKHASDIFLEEHLNSRETEIVNEGLDIIHTINWHKLN